MINEMALTESKKVYEEDQDERAKEAGDPLRESLGCLSIFKGSLLTTTRGKGFHDLPDGLFGENLLKALCEGLLLAGLAENSAMT